MRVVSRGRSKRRGYMVERKIRMAFEKAGWRTIRAGASLGEVDVICIMGGKCVLLQVKSTKKEKFYYYDYSGADLEGFPFFLVVDFGYGKIRVTPPKGIVTKADGIALMEFISSLVQPAEDQTPRECNLLSKKEA